MEELESPTRDHRLVSSTRVSLGRLLSSRASLRFASRVHCSIDGFLGVRPGLRAIGLVGWVIGLPCLEDAIDQAEESAHDGGDDDFGATAFASHA